MLTSADGAEGAFVVDEAAGADSCDCGAGGAVVELLGATRCAGASADGAGGVVVVVLDAGVVVLVLGGGVGVVVGCAAAIPPPDASNAVASDAIMNVFAGEARFGRGEFKYFVDLTI